LDQQVADLEAQQQKLTDADATADEDRGVPPKKEVIKAAVLRVGGPSADLGGCNWRRRSYGRLGSYAAGNRQDRRYAGSGRPVDELQAAGTFDD